MLPDKPDGHNQDPTRSPQTWSESHEQVQVIPVVAEELLVLKGVTDLGGVRVTKSVETHNELAEAVLAQEHLQVERVTLNRIVLTAPGIRQEGETLIVPILEEVMVVEKRLMLREELRVTRKVTQQAVQREVPLRRENVKVERLEPEGEASEKAEEGASDGKDGYRAL